MKQLFVRCLAAAALFVSVFVWAQPAANPISTYTLPNGMTLVVKPDRRAPTAVHMLWLRVGSMDEVDGVSGVAHVLEHMLFKGTPSVKAGEFSRRWPLWAGAKTHSPAETTPVTFNKYPPTVWPM